MSSFEPVRVVVVGVGNFGRLHARTLEGLAEAELAGVVDTNPRAVESLRRDFAKLRSWRNIEEALEESNAEAFIVATQTNSHIDLAEKILRKGRTVLVEKPLAEDCASARRLAPHINGESSNFMAGHILLFAPEVRRLVSEIRERGDVRFISAARHRPAGISALYAGETPFTLTMVHDLYLACAFLEGREPTDLFGQLGQNAKGESDLALAELHWADGVWGSFTASFLTPKGMADDGFDRLEVFGGGWSARLRLNPQSIEIWTEKHEWPIGLNIHDDPGAPSGWLAEELRHLCRVVRGRAKVPVGARYCDAVQVQRWIEVLRQCAMKGSKC